MRKKWSLYKNRSRKEGKREKEKLEQMQSTTQYKQIQIPVIPVNGNEKSILIKGKGYQTGLKIFMLCINKNENKEMLKTKERKRHILGKQQQKS